MSDVYEALQIWRNEDHEDNRVLSRHEIIVLLTEIEQLRALVNDLADDLEAELNGHYPPEIRAYPSEQRRYERDMANVYEARRELKP